ncbi:hypothetical protein [Actinoplanes sp. URMC 104]|uniref:hypothetical protein n=1 Tax=Actinoplanes sp. URMC 104 TaxID=3423409 RepID=UPI003F1DC7E3
MTPEQHRARAEGYLSDAEHLYDGFDDLDAATVAHLTMLGALAQAHPLPAQPAPERAMQPGTAARAPRDDGSVTEAAAPRRERAAVNRSAPYTPVPMPALPRPPGEQLPPTPGGIYRSPPSHVPTNEKLDMDTGDI